MERKYNEDIVIKCFYRRAKYVYDCKFQTPSTKGDTITVTNVATLHICARHSHYQIYNRDKIRERFFRSRTTLKKNPRSFERDIKSPG